MGSLKSMHDGATPRVFKYARILRNNMTEPEVKLWNYLKNYPCGYKFRRQHPINKFILDFYCHQKKLSIEVDGLNHRTKNKRAFDLIRTKYLNSVGIKEIRFTNDKVLNNIASVKSSIEKQLQRS